jgi:Protein of unknown function (DUF2490)
MACQGDGEALRSELTLGRWVRRPLLLSLFFCQLAGDLCAQTTSGQIWANFTLDHPKEEHLVYELDLEPKGQVSGNETWRALDVAPSVEYYPKDWMDVVVETALTRTRQSNEVSSLELTPRLGVRVHFLSRLRMMLPGPRPLGRVSLANFSRVEWRNLWYSDDTPDSHQTRYRNRVELKVGLNHKELSLDNTLFLVTDVEVFVPLSDDVPETFATKRRIRAGLGYRHDSKWRFELLFIRDGTRTTEAGSFATAANIVDFRLRFVQ